MFINSDWLAITGSGIEAPPLNAFHGVFIKTQAQRSFQPDPGNLAGFINNDVENHRSLILGSASLLGKLGLRGNKVSRKLKHFKGAAVPFAESEQPKHKGCAHRIPL